MPEVLLVWMECLLVSKKKPDTLNEIFAASKIPPGKEGSWWLAQAICPRCHSRVWYGQDGVPQVHACERWN